MTKMYAHKNHVYLMKMSELTRAHWARLHFVCVCVKSGKDATKSVEEEKKQRTNS